MKPEEMAEYSAFDDAADKAGGFVDSNPVHVKWNLRDVLEYCRQHSIDPEKLSDEELQEISKTSLAKKQSAA